jgi:hypothetical protein
MEGTKLKEEFWEILYQNLPTRKILLASSLKQ